MINNISQEIRTFWKGLKNQEGYHEVITTSYDLMPLEVHFESYLLKNIIHLTVSLKLFNRSGLSVTQELYMGAYDEIQLFLCSSELDALLKTRLQTLSSALDQT